MAVSRQVETRRVAWRYNEIWFIICVAECVLSKDPGNLFGSRRLDFDKNVQYDQVSSDQRRGDTSKTAKASGGSTTTHQTQAVFGTEDSYERPNLSNTGIVSSGTEPCETYYARKGILCISPEKGSDECEYREGTQYLKHGEGKSKGSKE